MEKKCPTRFAEGFVDPEKEFLFGEWVNAVPWVIVSIVFLVV